MNWLYQFYKSGKAKLFTITIDGIIKELIDKDFDFITLDEDKRILEKNKSKIAFNIFKKHGFTTDEINNWYETYKKNTEKLTFVTCLIRRGDREREFSHIISAICNIISIDEMLRCNMKDRNYNGISSGSILRIIESSGNHGNDKYARIRFSDEYNISEYLPGYFKKHELWDYLRTHTIDHKTFIATVKGEYDYLKDHKNQKNIDDAWK